MRVEVLTAVKMSIFVFWVVTTNGLTAICSLCYQNFNFRADDGDIIFLQNVDIYL
jgi:hypothetical protein